METRDNYPMAEQILTRSSLPNFIDALLKNNNNLKSFAPSVSHLNLAALCAAVHQPETVKPLSRQASKRLLQGFMLQKQSVRPGYIN